MCCSILIMKKNLLCLQSCGFVHYWSALYRSHVWGTLSSQWGVFINCGPRLLNIFRCCVLPSSYLWFLWMCHTNNNHVCVEIEENGLDDQCRMFVVSCNRCFIVVEICKFKTLAENVALEVLHDILWYTMVISKKGDRHSGTHTSGTCTPSYNI